MYKEIDIPEKILTIIIPMYQSKPFIKKCLDSMILDEIGMQKLEILVVNDGSKDGAERLVEKYVLRWPDTVRLLNKENGGHGSAINMGVAVCRGIFFKVVDADDWVDTKGLKNILKILQNRNMKQMDAVLAGYQIHDIHDDSVEIKTFSFDQESKKTMCMRLTTALHDWSKYKSLFTLHGLIYRTDFYRAVGLSLPEHVYYDDAYFDVVYVSRAARIGVTNEILYVYRVGDENQSISAQNREMRIQQFETVLLKICKALQNESVLSATGKCYGYKRMVSFLADYYVTTFLRFKDRKKGRTAAREFSHKIKKINRKLYRMCRGRYRVLLAMHIMHMKEKHIEIYFNVRDRIWYSRKTFRSRRASV